MSTLSSSESRPSPALSVAGRTDGASARITPQKTSRRQRRNTDSSRWFETRSTYSVLYHLVALIPNMTRVVGVGWGWGGGGGGGGGVGGEGGGGWVA